MRKNLRQRNKYDARSDGDLQFVSTGKLARLQQRGELNVKRQNANSMPVRHGGQAASRLAGCSARPFGMTIVESEARSSALLARTKNASHPSRLLHVALLAAARARRMGHLPIVARSDAQCKMQILRRCSSRREERSAPLNEGRNVAELRERREALRYRKSGRCKTAPTRQNSAEARSFDLQKALAQDDNGRQGVTGCKSKAGASYFWEARAVQLESSPMKEDSGRAGVTVRMRVPSEETSNSGAATSSKFI